MATAVISGLCAIIVALIGLIGVQLSTRRDVKQAVTNTEKVGNGFTLRLFDKLEAMDGKLDALDERVRKVEAKTDIWDRRKW